MAMSSSNPPEPQAESGPAPDNQPQTGTTSTSRLAQRPCPFYRSSRGCFKGDDCPWSHSNGGRPQTTKSPASSDSIPQVDTPAEASSSSTPGEPQNDQPRRQPNRTRGGQRPYNGRGSNQRGFRSGRGRGRSQPSEEQVKEQAIAQSIAAKAANAKKVTIVSEDDETSWTLEREFLSNHSKTLGLVLSFSRQKAEAGAKDPIKTIRGLLRFGENMESLQLDDVKAEDFDTFLEGLRATKETEFSLEDLQTILTLASDWGCEEIRNRTIRDIEKLHPSPIDRAVLARRCKIAKWIRGALLSLTILPDPLNAAEIQILGTTTAALIWRAREEIFLHRVQALATADAKPARNKCTTSAACKKEIRGALLRVLEKPGTAGKNESDLAGLVENEFVPAESTRKTLCKGCKSDAGLKDVINEMVGELRLARIIMEVQLGKEGGKWLEPA